MVFRGNEFVIKIAAFIYYKYRLYMNRIGCEMVSMLASSAVYHRFEPWSVQTKDYKIGICCFSTKHAALRRKSIVWLVQNRDNVSEWGDMSIHRLLFQCVRFTTVDKFLFQRCISFQLQK